MNLKKREPADRNRRSITMSVEPHKLNNQNSGLLGKVIRFCLENKLAVILATLFFVGWGVMVAPFDWNIRGVPRSPVPVDAIPDLGENQQIVFTMWPGRSPQDVEDQITYPLTIALLGVPEVKSIRSTSMFGFSTISVIFREKAEFYWTRTRILEKLNSLSPGTLPENVQPKLGPDATPLGQIFWYTLEGRDKNEKPTGGWDLHELRTIQDWKVKYELAAIEGVSEVASIGGYVKEYQIDVDPDAMRAHGVGLNNIIQAVKMSNADVGARTIEVNRVEYVLRGIGFIKSIKDIEQTVVKVSKNVPIRVSDIAKVSLGPALRRGALDKDGAEAVGGVVVVRYGANPLDVIKRVKEKINQINMSLGSKTVDGEMSNVKIIPFYDRTRLIRETLGTLESAITEEIFVTIIVVLIMVWHLRSSALISGLLPLAVLMCFVAMKLFGVDANVVALSGIAIAIGTIVDMGIILCENILQHLDRADPDENRLEVVFRAAREVGGAVLTAISTTIVSFLPVFAMTGESGKLYKPLAFTKSFALLASVIVALTIIPPLAHILFTRKKNISGLRNVFYGSLIAAGIATLFFMPWWAGTIIIGIGAFNITESYLPKKIKANLHYLVNGAFVIIVFIFLTEHWMPLGLNTSFTANLFFILLVIGGFLGGIRIFMKVYEPILRWCLKNKLLFMCIPLLAVIFGAYVWLGPEMILGDVPETLEPYRDKTWEELSEAGIGHKIRWTIAQDWKGRGKEPRPPLEEGSFLLMPVTMPHAAISEAIDILQKQDRAIRTIPEVESVVGKIGRAESPLDPAPISMIETVINYKSEWITDENGNVLKFKIKEKLENGTQTNEFVLDENGRPIPDPNGLPFRQWGDDVKSPNDIWKKIQAAATIPGTTTASKLQPIAARLVMLQTGIRSALGMKIIGDSLEKIEAAGKKIETLLKKVPSIDAATVVADRIVGKPYLEIKIDREAIARFGIHIRQVQDVIETAIGGKPITTTVEGRERYPVRARYLRELRDTIESLGTILIPAPDGTQIPLVQLTNLHDLDDVYRRGPQAIKGENAQLVGYVTFGKKPGIGDIDVVREAEAFLRQAIEDGELVMPGRTNYEFIVGGKTIKEFEKEEGFLAVTLIIAVFIIFMILYFQFRSVPTTFTVFTGIFVAWAGGFIMLWCYAQPWFMDFSVFGQNIRALFQMHPVKMSTAVWVGFLALFGIATDDGVVITTYLRQTFKNKDAKSTAEIHEAIVEAALRRVRPCLMTTATTILALLPVLSSTGRGSDIMVPMAIPSFGGMLIQTITLFVVPILYCTGKEWQLNRNKKHQR